MIFFYKKTGYPDSVTRYQPKPTGYCITRVTQFRFWFSKIKNHVLQFRFPALAKNQELDQVYTPTITINAPLYAIQFSSCFLLQLVFHAYSPLDYSSNRHFKCRFLAQSAKIPVGLGHSYDPFCLDRLCRITSPIFCVFLFF